MSKIEVNTVDVQCGSTLTLGSAGKTVAIASGASTSGMGRAGAVDWVTTAVTSTPTTGVSGKGYFINSTGGAKTVNLPASPSAGDIMAVVDYAGTADTNNITIGRNGSNINGVASDQTITKENSGATFVYVDGTQGWKLTETANVSDIVITPEFIVATGGTITTSGNCKIHKFTGPGTFQVTNAGNCAGSNKVSYLVVAGGGSAGNNYGGGGGGGGFREGKDSFVSYTASPLIAPDGLSTPVASYPIVVGGGGSESTPSNSCNNGSDSSFISIR